ncbi:hypothetical protein BV25DRAFT_1820336 [Artomyces pyxidatus]|uniref:Uncharacterized protein n=1 Tax=Artomyces pyxidatus TaxID=48021 RepID=A0ACB8TDE0_9AGAM|nr:hypothetical protein BV25DRAFT_1820336 [Artomyces pyxidatus]
MSSYVYIYILIFYTGPSGSYGRRISLVCNTLLCAVRTITVSIFLPSPDTSILTDRML